MYCVNMDSTIRKGVYILPKETIWQTYKSDRSLEKDRLVQRFRQRYTGIQGRGLERLFPSIQGTVTTYNLQTLPLAAMREGFLYIDASKKSINERVTYTYA